MTSLKTIDEVIKKEFEIIQERRKRKKHPHRGEDDNPQGTPEKEKANNLIGLALSGGGIRSAATNLGLLQGLSETKVLPKVDYLSTVSGGGYIGACLSSLLSNNCRRKISSPTPYFFDEDGCPLFSTDWKNFPFREDRIVPQEVAKQDELCGKIQMDHIRTNASYLVTRARHFSANLMRAVGAVFGSTFMSLLWFILLITLLTSTYMWVVALVAPDMKMAPSENIVPHIRSEWKSDGAFSFSVEAEVGGKKFIKKKDRSKATSEDLKIITGYAKTPFTKFWAIQSPHRWIIGSLIIGLGAIILYLINQLPCAPRIFSEKYYCCFLVYLGVLVLLLFLAYVLNKFFLAYVLNRFFNIQNSFFPIQEVAEGAILLVPSLFAGGALIGGWLRFVKSSCCDASQRLADRSYLHQLMGVLVIGFLFTLFLAVLPGFMSVGTSLFNSLLLLAVGTGLRYTLAGQDDKKGKKNKKFTLPPKFREWLLGLCILFFAFLTVVYAGNVIRDTLLDGNWPANAGGTAEFLNTLFDGNWPANIGEIPDVIKLSLILIISLVLLLLVFSRLVDANKISPHYFYRDRLAEIFLQTKISEHNYLRNDAEMKFAQQHGTTDTDCLGPYLLRNDSEMKLTDLHGTTDTDCLGPYLLMNATLNLTASQDLKAFNRKSDIFTFSRCFIGSKRTRFIETNEYDDPPGSGKTLKVARAMAISGAAVTSVMGMNSSLARSFACTIFGVRLGYWLKNFSYATQIADELELIKTTLEQLDSEISQEGNSKNKDLIKRKRCCEKKKKSLEKQKDRATQSYWNNFGRLFKELIGHTTATDKEIYLSDGGHCGDNLGIIPLLQRRVKILLVSDSECDPDHAFDSFNSSVRNAYVDEGIQIKINLDGLRTNEKGLTTDKFAVGRIIYPEQNRDQKNWLVLFKNTMTGDEIAPIVNYKEKNADFPHESTGDQFFTEEQFESYRALGRFAVFNILRFKYTWLAACQKSAKITEVNCGAAYDDLIGSGA